MDKFWDSVSDKLAERWATALMGPAAVFWIALGMTAYLAHPKRLLDEITALFWFKFPLLVATAALVSVILSSFVVDQIVPMALRILEGYWPDAVRRFFSRRWLLHRQDLERQWSAIIDAAGGDVARIPIWERAKFLGLGARLANIPMDDDKVMPTHLGNVIRAAEDTPYQRYGLDAVRTWVHLWLVLPEVAKEQISQARAQLNSGVRSIVWLLIYAVAVFFVSDRGSVWLCIVSLAVVYAVYRWSCGVAAVYGALIISAYDLYRHNLYAQLRLPAPSDPNAEPECGQAVSQYLFRGWLPRGTRYIDNREQDDP